MQKTSLSLTLLLALSCAREAATDEAASDTQADAPALQSTPLKPASGGTSRLQLLSAEQTGIDFESSFEWEHEKRHLYMHGYAGGGVCIGDYDGDGLPDIYLVSQTGPDKLYRQIDALRFEDVSAQAGISSAATWGTGAVFADIEGDGDLDLYVCNLAAPNRLYVNRGDGTFAEEATQRGLDFDGASVMASFADYDLDGHLDLYLLTNRLYPGPLADNPETVQVAGKVRIKPGTEEAYAIQERPIGGEIQKFVVKAGQRDRLFRNAGDGTFEDASLRAGILGNHPGLSATWWDYDDDGYPDVYVCNDFFDPDRLYHNERDGTFRDVIREVVPHTPWFSMGSDQADVNNDGRVDFLAADMSATTHFMSKIMMGDMNDSRWFLESAEPRQYMRNAMYLNTGTDRVMEVAYLMGVASTDWTWSVKFGDFDNDGFVDLFASNGTANHSFDPDLNRKQAALAADLTRRGIRDPLQRREAQWELYRSVPPRREVNALLRNVDGQRFEDVAADWGLTEATVSFGAAVADLDRDGDLDLVVNNVGDPVTIARNDSATGGRVLVRLVGTGSNRWGLGARVEVHTDAGQQQVRVLTPTSGYMSANEPLVHFGLGAAQNFELRVRWPSGAVQSFDELAPGMLYTVHERGDRTPAPASPTLLFDEISAQIGLDGAVRESPHDDYAKQPLLPARLSQLGPGLAWGDADGDGDDDLFVGGPAGSAGSLYLRTAPRRFEPAPEGPWVADRACEDMGALWLDVEGDGDLDLFVASGGIEADEGSELLRDRIYLNDGGGNFEAAPDRLPPGAFSSGHAAAADFDRDGDLDLFIGGRSVPGKYPTTPRSRLLRNDAGRFADVTDAVAPGLAKLGMVTSALWSDASGDGAPDLMVALEWGAIHCFVNQDGKLVSRTREAGLVERTGWWSGLAGGDLDGDGDIDYVALNAGLNHKYSASPEKPALLYYGDFDGNGPAIVEAKEAADCQLPVRGRSCSTHAMPFVGQKMPTYRDFAGASLEDIYGAAPLEQSVSLAATHLESGVWFNESGEDGLRFRYEPLPHWAQAAPGYGAVACDFDGDTRPDLFVAQNFFGREPETGHWDGGLSLLLRGAEAGALEVVWPDRSGVVVPGDAKAASLCDLNDDGRPDVVLTQNDDVLRALENTSQDARFVSVRLRGRGANPGAVGARVTYSEQGSSPQTAEVYAGSGYLAQSAAQLFFGSRAAGGKLRVRWPNGRETHVDVGERTQLVVEENP